MSLINSKLVTPNDIIIESVAESDVRLSTIPLQVLVSVPLYVLHPAPVHIFIVLSVSLKYILPVRAVDAVGKDFTL